MAEEEISLANKILGNEEMEEGELRVIRGLVLTEWDSPAFVEKLTRAVTPVINAYGLDQTLNRPDHEIAEEWVKKLLDDLRSNS